MTKKALNKTDFDQLEQDSQIRLLHRAGTFIGKRKINGRYYVLMQLYSFYVEIRYREYRIEIEAVLTTDDVNITNPYISQVRVRGIDEGK